jgi:hypothetical protein
VVLLGASLLCFRFVGRPAIVSAATNPQEQVGADQSVRPLARIGVAVVVDPAQSQSRPRDIAPASYCRVEAPQGSEPWAKWVDFENGPRVSATSSDERTPVYAVKDASGVYLLAANHSDSIAALQVRFKLQKGIYSLQKRGFKAASRDDRPTTERMQSVLLKAPGWVTRPAWLLPGTAMVLSVCDETRTLGRSLQAARTSLHGIATKSPRAFRLIRSPFGDAAARLEKIASQGASLSRGRLISLSDRAAMFLSHTRSVFGNVRSAGSLSASDGDDIGGALDRLEGSLSRISCFALDLVPNAAWGPADAAARKSPFNVELSNRGQRSLRLVKMAVTAPEDCRISPDEQAIFRSVRPGETVKATFFVENASAEDLTSVRADISYLAGRAPARLRIDSDGR